MLQQTQVNTVIPYYKRWMERFPSVGKLANASEEEVLKLWEGLGYYSRARNIFKSAVMIQTHFYGKLPDNYQALEKLPGIGKYTSGAIASIAFNQDKATIDGNIRRVLTRVFNISLPIGSIACEKKLWNLAETNLLPGQAGKYNQALMELGALICTPNKPECEICPLTTICLAYQLDLQLERPVKKEKQAIPHYHVVAGVIRNPDGQVLISKRPPTGLLGGMWEFPGGKIESGEDAQSALKRELLEELDIIAGVGQYIGKYKHAYTHYRVTLMAYYCVVEKNLPRAMEDNEIKWTEISKLGDYPMGKLDRMISNSIMDPNIHL